MPNNHQELPPMFRAHDSGTIEARLDNGSLVRLTWLETGGLSIEHYLKADLRDGHGWMLSGATQVGPTQARTFAQAGAGSLKKLGEFAYVAAPKR